MAEAGRATRARILSQGHGYQPAMVHAKVMLVDRVWPVVGSTNFDDRCFGLHDEVNLAAPLPRKCTDRGGLLVAAAIGPNFDLDQ